MLGNFKTTTHVTLVAPTDGGKIGRFQSVVFRDLKGLVLKIIPLNGHMDEHLGNLNDVMITAVYMNAESLYADYHLI